MGRKDSRGLRGEPTTSLCGSGSILSEFFNRDIRRTCPYKDLNTPPELTRGTAMSSKAPTKKLTPTNSLPSKTGLLAWLMPLASSTVGNKILVAVTGVLLTGFVIAHLIGNLKMFEGPDSINAYAVMLKSNPAVLWTMRLGLLSVFVIHLIIALRLKFRSMAARPVPYVVSNTIQASLASRLMPLTGVMILLFVVFHIGHYTLGVVHAAGEVNYLQLHDGQNRHDVYRMVIAGFSTPWLSIVYLIAQALLWVHLSHGIGSVFQTFGLNTQRTQRFVYCVSWTIASLIFVGNCAIVVAVWTGQVK